MTFFFGIAQSFLQIVLSKLICDYTIPKNQGGAF